jgi:hypothetical protein
VETLRSGEPLAHVPPTAAAAVAAAPKWGIYLPTDVYAVVAWLKAGDLKEESDLLMSLSRMPMELPRPPDGPATWRNVAPPPAIAALDTSLPDGFAGLLAPAMPGALL